MIKVMVIHGPNLGLLGKRETQIYGTTTLEEINHNLTQTAKELGLTVDFFQSDHEGDLVEKIGSLVKSGYDYLVINPAAYTHTSVAIRDAIEAVKIPTLEVHLSNIHAREEFRHQSFVSPVALGQISGFGPVSYNLALQAIAKISKK